MNNPVHAFKSFQKTTSVFSEGTPEQEDIWRASLPRLQQIFHLLVWPRGTVWGFLGHSIIVQTIQGTNNDYEGLGWSLVRTPDEEVPLAPIRCASRWMPTAYDTHSPFQLMPPTASSTAWGCPSYSPWQEPRWGAGPSPGCSSSLCSS